MPANLWILGGSATPLPVRFEKHIGKDLLSILKDSNGNKITTSQLCSLYPNEPVMRYNFFELDRTDPESFNEVISEYKARGIGVLSHRTRRGYHFFGERTEKSQQIEIIKKLIHLRDDACSYNTLRLVKKDHDEVYESPVWHGGERPGWSKSLGFFINRIVKGEAKHSFDENIKRTGLNRWFVTTIYPLCQFCYESLEVSKEGKLKHYKQKHDMIFEGN